MSTFRIFWRQATSAIFGLVVSVSVAAAQEYPVRDGRLTFSIVGGQMTTNGIDEVFLPARVDLADSNFVGVVFGYERPLDDMRWQIGAELQVNHHFGQDTYQEFVLPFTVRYSPARPWPAAFDSFAFGLGLSHATETPLQEVIRRGTSQRTLLYFSLETAFAVGADGDNVFLRLHHRSDAYGLFANNSGSNAFAVGYRMSF